MEDSLIEKNRNLGISENKENNANTENTQNTEGSVGMGDTSGEKRFVGTTDENGVLKEEVKEVVIKNSVVDRGAQLLENILANGRPVGTIEETWERIILAEKMRFVLHDLYGGEESVENEIEKNVDSEIERKSENESLMEQNIVSDNSNSNNDSDNNSDRKYGRKSNPSLSYVSYINKNFNSVKRIAAVQKN